MTEKPTSDPLPPLHPGMIRFHQAALPPLPPGDYTLNVTQTLSGAKADDFTAKRQAIGDTFTTKSDFTVAGPRFFLKPTEVYSVYPPAGQFGAFNNSLPHIVFTRRTLPWERTLAGEKQDPAAPVPWMALLLLGQDDFDDKTLPKVKAMTVGQLREPGDDIQGPVRLDLDGGQTDGDLCNTIDLPRDVFTEIVPTLKDLPYLAHVREVNTGGKETLSLKQDGWFTVVLGNRLPATTKGDEGKMNLACLVSLEGFRDHLPTVDAAGNAKTTIPAEKLSMRMAVLASWYFTCYGDNDFKARMVDLDDQSLLTQPTDGLTGDDVGVTAVKEAFSLGYSGLNHTTRLGEKTVSWYRGPLVPFEMKPQSPFGFIPAADSALRYNYNDGMFAVEYASAYELGRLLALQNRGFAAAMYRYRASVRQQKKSETMRRTLADRMGVEADPSAKDGLEKSLSRILSGGTK